MISYKFWLCSQRHHGLTNFLALEIAKWRVGGEAIVLREHTVHQVYISNEHGDDLLMTGVLALESDIGLAAESPFCARCVVEDVDTNAPRIAYWQVWMVSGCSSLWTLLLLRKLTLDGKGHNAVL